MKPTRIAAGLMLASLSTIAGAQYATRPGAPGFVTVRGSDPNSPALISYPLPANSNAAAYRDVGYALTAGGIVASATGNPAVGTALGITGLASTMMGAAASSITPVGPQPVTFFDATGKVIAVGTFVIYLDTPTAPSPAAPAGSPAGTGGPTGSAGNPNGTGYVIGTGSWLWALGWTAMSIPPGLNGPNGDIKPPVNHVEH